MWGSLITIPFDDPVSRPFFGLVVVTFIAGIRGSVSHALIRPGDPKAVIPSEVIAHVIPSRHMTVDTKSGLGSDLMKVMFLGVVLSRNVAL